METFDFLLNRWTVMIVAIGLMIVGLLPEYTLKAVRMIGMMGWAEQSIGRGGTFSVWKIIGIIAPIIAIVYFFTPSIQYKSSSKQVQQTPQPYQEYYNNYNDPGY